MDFQNISTPYRQIKNVNKKIQITKNFLFYIKLKNNLLHIV